MNDKIKPTEYVTENEFHAFVRVQKVGTVNMASPKAAAMAIIDKDTHMHILRHYEELYESYGEPK